jgi:hypothetical protein
MNWEECERKQSWPNLGYCLGICLEGLKFMRNLSQVDVLVEIRTEHLPETNMKNYRLSQLARCSMSHRLPVSIYNI